MTSKSQSINGLAAHAIAVMTAGYIAHGYDPQEAVNKARATIIHLLHESGGDAGMGVALGLMMINFTVKERDE